MAEQQLIPARHGVATFVPAGQTIKIINTTGTQVVDTWAFALPKPDPKADDDVPEDPKNAEKKEAPTPAAEEKAAPKPTAKPSKKNDELPSQEDAEKATKGTLKQSEQSGAEVPNATSQKSKWSSYVPSLGLSSANKSQDVARNDETEQQKDSRTWASYFPSGKAFTPYIPKSAGDRVSAFAKDHQRDTSKSYLAQLQDFSKTPVGAASLAALAGSGYSGSLYAGYQAWNVKNAPDAPPMEFMSMPHSRAATLHLRPHLDDTLVSNLREPMLRLVEDTSSGIHDTLIAACDPQRYKGLGVDDWEQHGSCAENLVLALKELNENAGLRGAKGIGADVTVNNVPAPLNLFMNIPWDDDGDLGFKAPKTKKGGYVRFRAERDVVVVMSACPQDVLDINNRKPTDAHFLVEDGVTTPPTIKGRLAAKRPPARKLNSAQEAQPAAGADGGDEAKASTAPVKRPTPPQAAATQQTPDTPTGAASPTPRKKPVPKPVSKPARPQKQLAGETSGDANGTPPPVERKKPRKLSTRPKA